MSSEEQENPVSPSVTEGLKKKRGRPKKQSQEDAGNTAVSPRDAVESQPVKKPRGRPKGSKKVAALTGGTAKPPAGKKGRGRPRKWPQAVVQEESQGGNSQESSDLNLNSTSATQGITGKDGSRSGKTTGIRKGFNIPAAAQ